MHDCKFSFISWRNTPEAGGVPNWKAQLQSSPGRRLGSPSVLLPVERNGRTHRRICITANSNVASRKRRRWIYNESCGVGLEFVRVLLPSKASRSKSSSSSQPTNQPASAVSELGYFYDLISGRCKTLKVRENGNLIRFYRNDRSTACMQNRKSLEKCILPQQRTTN
ncbi:hypothetical protein HZH66_005020 [Vespula vulgaris]|uniref:Uncharacterized protein n=1 Tax=Vespula vulgaris TaxID=7454 RepID=A0A834NCU2_VESVU|nr:hypothetical protein HZH66_005020 [Vespula vulgaris]